MDMEKYRYRAGKEDQGAVALALPGAGHLCRGGRAQYLSGFAPGREARSQPGVTVAGGPRSPIGCERGPRALYS